MSLPKIPFVLHRLHAWLWPTLIIWSHDGGYFLLLRELRAHERERWTAPGSFTTFVTCAVSHANIDTRVLSFTQTYTHAHAHARTVTSTHTRAHTHKHTHTMKQPHIPRCICSVYKARVHTFYTQVCSHLDWQGPHTQWGRPHTVHERCVEIWPCSQATQKHGGHLTALPIFPVGNPPFLLSHLSVRDCMWKLKSNLRLKVSVCIWMNELFCRTIRLSVITC